MARGWESKSVEAQQSEAADKPASSRVRLSPKQAATAREKQSLDLSRKRVLQQLAAAGNPKLRQMLEEALADLDRRLQQLQ